MTKELLVDSMEMIEDEFLFEAEEYKPVPKTKMSAFHSINRIAAVLLVLPLLAIMFILLSIPVMAATGIEPAYELLYSISPEIAQALKPINASVVDNGIRMKVSSIDVSNDEAWVYISLKDLEQERVTESTTLFDSYSINVPTTFCSSSCRAISYNTETGEKTFLIRLWWNKAEGIDLKGKKVTFIVREFLSDRQATDQKEIFFPLSEIIIDPPTKKVHLIGRGGNFPSDDSIATVMILPESERCSPVTGIYVLGAGIIDDMIHVQVSCDNPLSNDTNCVLNSSKYSMIWFNDDHSKTYHEFVFPVDMLETDGFRVTGDFWTYGNRTEGKWVVTFAIPK